jgi:hypothetical protein
MGRDGPERSGSGHVQLAGRMQITDQIGAVFVDVAVEAELEIDPAQLFDEIVVGDLLINSFGAVDEIWSALFQLNSAHKSEASPGYASLPACSRRRASWLLNAPLAETARWKRYVPRLSLILRFGLTVFGFIIAASHNLSSYMERKMTMKKLIVLAAACSFALAIYLPRTVSSNSEDKNPVTFAKQIAPIFQRRCE